MMFRSLVGLTAALGIVGLATTAQAGKLKDITCEQFLAMAPDARDRVVYWAEGADVATTKKVVDAAEIEVGYDAFGEPVAEVVTACTADKKASLLAKVKSVFRK
jgi:HdeA/HdeB family